MDKSQEDLPLSFASPPQDQRPLLSEGNDFARPNAKRNGVSSSFLWLDVNKMFPLLLVVSLTANLIFGIYIGLMKKDSDNILRSKYSNLPNDLYTPFEWSTEYASDNLTLAGELWEAIDFNPGFVALPQDWTDSKDLPRAQPFPWDKSQGMYVLNGFHALHCIKNIHRAIRNYHLGLPQPLPLMHITHCIDSLRGDILCQADDTPRYTTVTKSPESAVGQIRQCRDWKKLEEWAKERTSCYNYISPEADHIDQFERFKFCPADSPYWPKVRKHFGKGPEWTPVSGDDITLDDGFKSINDLSSEMSA